MSVSYPVFFSDKCWSRKISTIRELDLLNNNLKSIHTFLIFLYDSNELIRCTINNLFVLGILISAVIRYAIIDKYEIEILKLSYKD